MWQSRKGSHSAFDSTLNSRVLLGIKENTVDLEAWCLFGFVIYENTALNLNVGEQKGGGYY